MSLGKLTYNGLIDIASGPIPFLLEDYIPAKSIGFLVGEWGSGKSPFALQLQLSMAANVPFLGKYKPTKENIKCLYVDLENGAGPVLSILASLGGHLGLNSIPNNWEVYSPNYGIKVPELERLTEDKYVKELIRREPPDFIIIDPLRMYKPDAESKNSEAAAMIRGLRELIALTGSTILFIHHPRKGPADASAERYKLDTNPTEWMQSAAGAGSLIQNADFRIGFECNDEGYIVCRRFLRNRGWFPSEYIDRVYDDATDEPIGYVLKLGIEQLTALERSWLNDLPHTFSTRDLKLINKKNDRLTNDSLKRWKSLLIVDKVGHGTWQKKI